MSILLYRCSCLSFFLSSLSLYLVRPYVFPNAIAYGTSTRNIQFFSIKTREGGGGGHRGQIKNRMPSMFFSHVGDLGNVYSDERGMISTKIVDHLVSLVGEYSVLGRSFVVSWSNLLTQLYGTSWFEYFPACSWCPFLGHERRSWQATDGCCGCYGNVG